MARQEIARGIVGLAIVALVGGCTSGSLSAPGSSAPATLAPLATSDATPTAVPTNTSAPTPKIGFQEFHDSFCSAWASLFDAVGNPDIGSGSDLTRAMDAAITAGDTASVDRLAGEITAELEVGRAAVARATGWTPASPLMAEVDRLLVGFEAMTEAKRAAASQGLSVAKQLGQTALQDSGATDAWFALIRPGILDETRAAIDAARPRDIPTQCPNLPIGI